MALFNVSKLEVVKDIFKGHIYHLLKNLCEGIHINIIFIYPFICN